MSKIQRVRGFPDKLSQDALHFDQVLSQSIEAIKSFDFERVETPILENTDLFIKTLGRNSDVVNKEMYTFQKGDESLTLRPEGTAPIARLFITEKLQQQLPLKFFYYGPMFRHERPQKGRFRQFYQLGAEFLGNEKEDADIEVLSMAWLLCKKLKISQKVSLEINTIGDFEERKSYIENLKNFLNPLSSQLSADSQRRLEQNPLRIWDSKEEQDKKIMEKAPLLIEHLKKESLAKYETIKMHLSQLKIPFTENLKLVRGLDYYNDLVFEITSSDLGSQSGVIAGGRYDSLVQTLGGPDTPAVGWGAGMERLLLLHQYQEEENNKIGIVSTGDEPQKEALKIAYQLRESGHSVCYRFSGNISKQMKRISQKKCRWACFYGEKEFKNKQVVLKDLQTQEQKDLSLSEVNNHLKKLL